ncbi:unnamed protein product [Gongylonema pulchrum]|uniref:Carn_acyltransf domain-containing protein n=1 Tax=Gongylonema pulchrum TaxID=637853 RepID=A0A183CXP3_9BILA|nr:unnamed protein product [Gongylonema pulchrum]
MIPKIASAWCIVSDAELSSGFQDQGKFALTYEATTTRLFREGRTETVRSCTIHSCEFVRAMLDPLQSVRYRLRLLRIACSYHQQLYRDAMSGRGVDRHLFAFKRTRSVSRKDFLCGKAVHRILLFRYIVMRYLELKSPFLERIFPPTFLLSTSQTPMNQCEEEMKSIDAALKLKIVTAGGGFGPVADRGYGVSYIIVGEDRLFFHISSKKSAENTVCLNIFLLHAHISRVV